MTDTLRALSDDKSLALFNMVAFTLPRDTVAVMTRLALTRKQFYSRMNQMIDLGLVTRKSDRYYLTSFGKVVYESHKLIGNAVENYWKLKAIDSIETLLSEDDLSVEEQRRIINALIERNDIKNILLNQNVPSDQDHKLLAALPNNNP
jgi:predicted transcriptional regulator